MEVLNKVGLQDHIHKKPNQLSGGQMQRVAIARALINNPDILLADEPTGALDTETSIQIMNLLKQIAEEKLVIMVTHNPELAEAYSTRIVNLKDGQITSDTNPFDAPEGSVEEKLTKNQKRVSMSFWTSLGLSFANLRTKIGRTILTSFAGSIGIIGIALILALSTGMNQYITRVQKETMTSYPITISSQTIDATSIMQLRGQMMGLSSQKETKEEDGKVHADYQSLDVYKRQGIYSGLNCHGEEKVRRYREVFDDTKIENFYSDSYSDTPLARIAENAYLVKGDNLLPWDKK